MNPRIVAHRGWTRDETENSLGALEAAITLGCAAVEFDTRVTVDGAWVVHHDADLRRIHGLEMEIASSKLSTLRAAAPVATLGEALALFGPGCRPMVEVKEIVPRHLETLADEIRAADASSPIVIVRGDLPRDVRAALPDTPLYLFGEDWDEAFSRCGEPIDGFDLRHDPVADARIGIERSRFHAAGKALAVWTINSTERAGRWLDAGVEWVITDHPERWAAV